MTNFTKTLTDSISIIETVGKELKQFLNEMQTDFETILGDVPFMEQVTWVKKTLIEDEMGRESSSSESLNQQIDIVLQPLVQKDRDVLGLGISVSGHMKAYVEHAYIFSGTSYVVDVGDFITTGEGDEYIVVEVDNVLEGGEVEVFRKIILREVGN